jgi:hypothetical protein
MARRVKGRPYNEDGYWFLRDLVSKAVDDTEGGLSGLCTLAGCERGRKSISNWLQDERRNAEGVRKARALPDAYAVDLMKFLSASEHYAEAAQKLRKQAIEWFNSMKPQRFSMVNIENREEKDLEIFGSGSLVTAFWYVDRYLGVKDHSGK